MHTPSNSTKIVVSSSYGPVLDTAYAYAAQLGAPSITIRTSPGTARKIPANNGNFQKNLKQKVASPSPIQSGGSAPVAGVIPPSVPEKSPKSRVLTKKKSIFFDDPGEFDTIPEPVTDETDMRIAELEGQIKASHSEEARLKWRLDMLRHNKAKATYSDILAKDDMKKTTAEMASHPPQRDVKLENAGMSDICTNPQQQQSAELITPNFIRGKIQKKMLPGAHNEGALKAQRGGDRSHPYTRPLAGVKRDKAQ